MSPMITQDDTAPVKPQPNFEERLARIDLLLCLLFDGLVNHPLATTMIPPDQLAAIKSILPRT